MLFKSMYTGIDLGEKNIKIVFLVKKRGNKTVKGFYQIENPVGKTTFDKPIERDAIKQCFKKINRQFPSKKVVIGVPSKHAVFRYVQFPLLNQKELKEAIFWELQEFDNMFNEDFTSDYELINKGKDVNNVLLVATPKRITMDYATIAFDSGLPLKALDIYPLANARVLKEEEVTDVTAILDLRSNYSEITIIDDGKVILSRVLGYGYNNKIKNRISEILETNKNCIEFIKNNLELFPLSYQNLILEVSRTFIFYSLQSKGRQIKKIILIGENGKLGYCKDIFESYFDVKVCTTDEYKFQFIKNDDNCTNYFSAIGFALRS